MDPRRPRHYGHIVLILLVFDAALVAAGVLPHRKKLGIENGLATLRFFLDGDPHQDAPLRCIGSNPDLAG
jgi:hypothetical protein